MWRYFARAFGSKQDSGRIVELRRNSTSHQHWPAKSQTEATQFVREPVSAAVSNEQGFHGCEWKRFRSQNDGSVVKRRTWEVHRGNEHVREGLEKSGASYRDEVWSVDQESCLKVLQQSWERAEHGYRGVHSTEGRSYFCQEVIGEELLRFWGRRFTEST